MKNHDACIQDILEVLKHFYTFNFKGYRKFDYKGQEITENKLLAVTNNIQDTIKPSNLKYSNNDQGRSPLEEILSKCFQLGYQKALSEKDNLEIVTLQSNLLLAITKNLAKDKKITELEIELKKYTNDKS